MLLESTSETGSFQRPLLSERLDLFPAPVFLFSWPEAGRWKAELLEAIGRRRRSGAGIVRTNRGGWHSEVDLPAWPEPAARALARWVAGRAQAATLSRLADAGPVAFGPWRMNGWANVNPPGGHNVLHDHVSLNWHWSACYYVDLPGIGCGEAGGALVFEDADSGLDVLGAPHRRSHRLVPAEGRLVLFPAWLMHRVEPHAADGERVSVAFNLHNAGLERSRLWKHRPRWAWRTFPRAMRRLAALRGAPDMSRFATPPGTDVDA